MRNAKKVKPYVQHESVPELKDLVSSVIERAKIARMIRRDVRYANEIDDLFKARSVLKPKLYREMKRHSLSHFSIDGLASVRRQLTGRNSRVSKPKLRAVLLEAGVSAANVNRIVNKSLVVSKGKMSVVVVRDKRED